MLDPNKPPNPATEATPPPVSANSGEAGVAARRRETFGAELRLLGAIAAPNVASTAAETMMSMVDFLIVSGLGSAAQAAVQSATLVFFTLFAFQFGVLACVTTVVSQSLGAGRPQDCARYAWQGIWFSLLLGLLGFALWPAAPFFYALLDHAPDVQRMEVGYTRIRLLGMGAAGASVALGHFFNGIHRPMHGAISVIFSNVLNAGLTYGLVFGVWGLPEMGVPGAALGTLIATVARAIWLFVVMSFSSSTAEYQALKNWRLDGEKLHRLIHVGWPSGGGFVLDISAWSAFMVVIIGGFGTAALAASAIIWRFAELCFMPAMGIGLAVCTLVGQAVGAGRPDLARRRAALGTLINMVYMSLMGLTLVIFRQPLIGFFTDEPEVLRIGTQLMIFVALYQLFDAVAITYSNALRGAGDTLWPMIVGACLAWGIMFGGSLMISRVRPDWGSNGPWGFAAGFIVVIGTTFLIRWRRGAWEKMDTIGRGAPAVGFELLPVEVAISEANTSAGPPNEVLTDV